MSLLSVRQLTASYGQGTVLHGVDVDVAEGGVTAVLGANGAGKTTFLRAVCGLVKREGSIVFQNTRIDKLCTEDIARRGIAHVPDGRGTFGSLTVDENLRLGAYVRRDKPAVQRDLLRMYEYFPRLFERKKQQAGTLSGGEQQMLAIARALMLAPQLLVLDEPSFGLAPLVVQEIFRIMRTINAEQRLAVLLVEQNASLALAFADHACVLETGRVVARGTPEALREDESLRRAYLGY
ncbi:MAG: transporter ATP-binding protein [Myxococcaceae bacterium]|nr:transporter ATP-binding protein [Myxococcaceae bacterium]